MNQVRLDTNFIDYAIVVTYFIVVLVFVVIMMTIVSLLDLGLGKLAFEVFNGNSTN